MDLESSKMTFSTMLKKSIRLLKDNFRMIFLFTLIFYGLPTFITYYGLLSFITLGSASDESSNSLQEGNWIYPHFWILLLVILVLSPLTYLSFFKMLSALVDGKKTSLMPILKHGLFRYFKLVAANAIAFIGFIIPFALLTCGIFNLNDVTFYPAAVVYFLMVFPIILFFNILAVVVSLEKHSIISAIKRTAILLKGHLWISTSRYFRTSLMIMIVLSIAMAGKMVVSSLIGMSSEIGFPGLIMNFIQTLVECAITPVSLIMCYLIYLDLLKGKENLTTETLNAPTEPDTASSPIISEPSTT